MALHLLAVFGPETAHAPQGLQSQQASELPHPRYPSPDDMERSDVSCKAVLQKAFDTYKPGSRHMLTIGKGCGFIYEKSPFCSYAHRDGVHVLMVGEVAQWPGIDAVKMSHDAFMRNEPPLEADDAHWLLDFYQTFVSTGAGDEVMDPDEVMDRALECLAAVQGNFSFVIYDAHRHRVLAARDREASQPLWWGCTDAGQLMFSSSLDDLQGCNPSATDFPAGSLFSSEQHLVAFSPGEKGWLIADDELPGQLLSFVPAEDAVHYRGIKAIPRITSKGLVCGAVYKVASAADMTKPIIH